MTMTVKLDAALERALRRRSVALGRSASSLMRDALQAYLALTEQPAPSAYVLGQDLFGKHAGPSDLANQHKAELQQIWVHKRPVMPFVADHGPA